jgi:transposase
MELYAAIDLHSNNSMLVVLDKDDHVILERRLPNDLDRIKLALAPHRESIRGIAVESTYNWYWLVDGLMHDGYQLHLVNTAAVKQYEGLKYSADQHDARWLAHLLRLGILPEGYIYPKAARAVRDLLRKRGQLVRSRTTQILSIQNLLARNLGCEISGNAIKTWTQDTINELDLLPEQRLAVNANWTVMQCLDEQIKGLERAILAQARLLPEFQALLTVSGIGKILALTIALETGDIGRFATVGDFTSYCRCVGSVRLSNGKKKGVGNTKNGNKHLAWAMIEAAHFAVRFDPAIKRFYQRKKTQVHGVVAIKSVAHKLARACYHVMREGVPFDVARAFA